MTNVKGASPVGGGDMSAFYTEVSSLFDDVGLITKLHVRHADIIYPR
jgi:hypothetical protein